MKIHWGAGLVGVSVLFAAVVLVMVVISMNQRVDLVSDDYYDQELKHQDRIDQVRRTKEAGAAPSVTADAGMIRIAFPSRLDRRALRGDVALYRPADRRMDTRGPLQLDSTNVQQIVATSMAKGRWRVQVRWQVDSVSFFHEDTVMVR
jgi:nitrogen fixation protein FixH